MIKLKIYCGPGMQEAIIYECPCCGTKCSTMGSWLCKKCNSYVLVEVEKLPTSRDERIDFYKMGKVNGSYFSCSEKRKC